MPSSARAPQTLKWAAFCSGPTVSGRPPAPLPVSRLASAPQELLVAARRRGERVSRSEAFALCLTSSL
eukprot:1949212-Lingulodinium_polyedra.AAC.1